MRVPEWIREGGDEAELASKAVEYLFSGDRELLEQVLIELADRYPVTYAKLYPLFSAVADRDVFELYMKIYVDKDVNSRALAEAGFTRVTTLWVPSINELYNWLNKLDVENYFASMLYYDMGEQLMKVREAVIEDEALYKVLSNESWVYIEAAVYREPGDVVPVVVACKDGRACKLAATILRDLGESMDASTTDLAKLVVSRVRSIIGEDKLVEVGVKTSWEFTEADLIVVRVPLYEMS